MIFKSAWWTLILAYILESMIARRLILSSGHRLLGMAVLMVHISTASKVTFIQNGRPLVKNMIKQSFLSVQCVSSLPVNTARPTHLILGGKLASFRDMMHNISTFGIFWKWPTCDNLTCAWWTHILAHILESIIASRLILISRCTFCDLAVLMVNIYPKWHVCTSGPWLRCTLPQKLESITDISLSLITKNLS